MFTLSSLVGLTAAAAPAAVPAQNPIMSIIPFVLIFVVFYFLLIRPQQQARKKHEELVQGVKRGDTVVTAGGLVGKVTKVSDGAEVTVKLAEGVEVQAIKATLSDVRGKNEPAKDEKDAKD
ncbi:MAG: preprotein translocase subunit YajC [Parvularculaceae bacterium]|nr:preprotein translocase subunit YajC [Parvularculaceae bacterium]